MTAAPGRGAVVEVDGGRELRASLKRAGANLDDLKDAHREAGQTVTAAALGRSPRSTGRLAASIRPGATRTSALIRAGGARVPYAGVVHWGGDVPGPHGHTIAPNPFISEAAQATEPSWAQAYHRAVQAVLDHVKGA